VKLKKLLLLAVVCLALGAWAWRSWKQERKQAVPEAIGKLAFPDLDVNQVRKLVVVTSDSTVSVARVSGTWIVPGRFGYPVDFSKVAQTLRELGDAKIWQVMNVADADLDAFNLLMPGQAPEGKRESEGAMVTLLGAQDVALTSFIVGKTFARKADPAKGAGMMISSGQDGQYVRLASGQVVILPTFLGRLIEDTQHWLADDFLNITPGQIAELSVSGTNRADISLRREGEPGHLVLQGLAEDEEVDVAKQNQLAGMLGYFSFHDVADPALPPSQTGLDAPVLLTAVTTQGIAYALSIGGPVSTNNPDRYVALKVSLAAQSPKQAKEASDDSIVTNAAPSVEATEIPQNPAEIVADLNQRLAPWVYIVKSYRIDPALVARGDLVVKKTPKTTEEASAQPAADDKEKKEKSADK